MVKINKPPKHVEVIAFRHKKKLNSQTFTDYKSMLEWMKGMYYNTGALFFTCEYVEE